MAILKGATEQVRALASSVLAERGVRNGRLIIVPAVMDAGGHCHDDAPHQGIHMHIRTR